MRKIDEIIIHCTVTRPDWMDGRPTSDKVAEVRRWHVEDNGWSDIGYHFLIDRDGTVVKGRPVEKAGAHTKGCNANSVGIALFGGHGASATDQFEDHFTDWQAIALRALITNLEQGHPITKVSGHNQYANKGCPGFKVGDWVTREPAREPRTSVTQSTTVQASAVQIASGAGAAASSIALLDGAAQLVALAFTGVVVILGLWIMRERIRHWAEGVR